MGRQPLKLCGFPDSTVVPGNIDTSQALRENDKLRFFLQYHTNPTTVNNGSRLDAIRDVQ